METGRETPISYLITPISEERMSAMKITTEMVDYISDLSRLRLPEEEKERVTGQLEQILAYMDVLNALDTRGVEPMSHVFPVKNVWREDEAAPSFDRSELLKNAPASDGEAFLVPRAVE